MSEALQALVDGGVRAVVWKGLAVAQRWPIPSLRPAGDLDLLVEPADLDRAAALLAPFAVAGGRPSTPSRLRPSAPGLELWPTAGRTLSIDLQTRPFRTVGSRLDGGMLLKRSTPSVLAGAACQVLDPADELLLVLVHGAKHGARSPRWVLDGWALSATGEDIWRQAWTRAEAASCTRPFLAMTALLDAIGVPTPTWLPSPPLGWRLLCDAQAARQSRPLTQPERYLAEVLFEPDLSQIARRFAGVFTRLFASRLPS